MHLRLLIVLLFCGQVSLQSQDAPSLRMHLSFEYGAQTPGGDLKDRFGNNFNLGAQYEILHMESLWHAGLKGYFLFGNEVREDVLALLRTPEGNIIGNDRSPAIVLLRERGFFIGPYVGKTFKLSEQHPHSGIKISAGAGLLQHKIRVQDDTRSVSQLTGDYLKGYDRLTNGLAFYGFVGYQHLDPQGRINFLAGFDLTAGTTQSRRDFNFDQQRADTAKRKDSLLGIRIGWILPITTGQPPDQIFY
ncbi:MAG: hypothetical protein R3301_14320 [Saprospiraceae bacterium]|nr:hypothetical protein [Saprospiraceae bacterium]